MNWSFLPRFFNTDDHIKAIRMIIADPVFVISNIMEPHKSCPKSSDQEIDSDAIQIAKSVFEFYSGEKINKVNAEPIENRNSKTKKEN